MVECEHVTSELLKAKEQMTELANSEAAMAQKLADIQKQHEIEGMFLSFSIVYGPSNNFILVVFFSFRVNMT